MNRKIIWGALAVAGGVAVLAHQFYYYGFWWKEEDMLDFSILHHEHIAILLFVGGGAFLAWGLLSE